jgi:hypothetical protein
MDAYQRRLAGALLISAVVLAINIIAVLMGVMRPV